MRTAGSGDAGNVGSVANGAGSLRGGAPSEYLFVRQLPRHSITAVDVKFCGGGSAAMVSAQPPAQRISARRQMTDLGRNELEPAGLAVVLLLDELEHLRVDLGQRLGLLDAAHGVCRFLGARVLAAVDGGRGT